MKGFLTFYCLWARLQKKKSQETPKILKNWKIENCNSFLFRGFLFFQFFFNSFCSPNWNLDQGFSNVIQFYFNLFHASQKLKMMFKKWNSPKEIWIPIFKKYSILSSKKLKANWKKCSQNQIPLRKTGFQSSKKKVIWMDFLARVDNTWFSVISEGK